MVMVHAWKMLRVNVPPATKSLLAIVQIHCVNQMEFVVETCAIVLETLTVSIVKNAKGLVWTSMRCVL